MNTTSCFKITLPIRKEKLQLPFVGPLVVNNKLNNQFY